MSRNNEIKELAARHGENIKKDYLKGESLRTIAKEYGTYVQKIFRVLVFLGVKLRDKSEAQKVALKEGRSVHPTEGLRLSPERKAAQGRAISEAYERQTQEQRDAKAKKAKERYEERSKESKENFRRKASEGVLKSAVKGSKLERFLLDELTKQGYAIVYHKKGFILNDKLEIDLLIPSMKVAIEVDGIFHYEDVWDNGSLEKVRLKDGEKNALLIQNGYIVIRLANTAKSCSKYYMRERLEVLVKTLEEIKKSYPPVDKRLIYLGD